MTRLAWSGLVMVAWSLALVPAASGQDVASSLAALAERVQVGQQVWVTDTAGRELGGRLERLTSDGLALRADRLVLFAGPDIRRVRARDPDSLKNGTLIGLGVGLGVGTAWCVGAVAADSGDVDASVECAEGFTVFPALGALIGLAIDAVIPGKVREVFRAAAPHEDSRVSLRVRPVFSPRVKGMTVSFVF